ncbi:hypothetical protein BDP27DRAFT_1233541 [Rhodocollybia butyracea]|uniref:CxC2-like cysteine cluster KDZ transposase-associated domain-containing protein n=1 Tax=Rhodocollybia butyracea TaxID=206335 RepID=A0A9P5PCC8_9AGAR|nr:hypothetical protein BDP27DRAFT_1233541 [Rhodocollybia butyracea]
MAVQDEYLDDTIYVEGRGLNGDSCAGCESPNPAFRCADEECVGLGMRCEKCIVKAHQHLPFHWIEEWDGEMFWTRTLNSLGLHVQLGHKAGSVCLFPQPANISFAVLYTNGIHQVNIDFCGCQPDLVRRTQLLRSHLWPATVFSPHSACTFISLHQFHTFNCMSCDIFNNSVYFRGHLCHTYGIS